MENEKFYGYCFDDKGFHTPQVNLDGVRAAWRYILLKMNLHHRVIVTDDSDSIVIEAIKGVVVFPEFLTTEDIDRMKKEVNREVVS